MIWRPVRLNKLLLPTQPNVDMCGPPFFFKGLSWSSSLKVLLIWRVMVASKPAEVIVGYLIYQVLP